MLKDPRRIRTAHSLLFSLPGTPLFMYGDEIGMGDDLSLSGRDAVRTAMQWSKDSNAGFSATMTGALAAPVITEGPYGYTRINVADQLSDPESLLGWMKRLIRMRRQCPEWGSGACSILDTDEPGVFAHRTEVKDSTLVALHNLTDKSCSVRIPHDGESRYVPLWGNGRCQAGHGSATFDLEPYGYVWYRVEAR
jgi:maltose alpha-D-glucosyltransferase/alpha-amylase